MWSLYSPHNILNTNHISIVQRKSHASANFTITKSSQKGSFVIDIIRSYDWKNIDEFLKIDHFNGYSVVPSYLRSIMIVTYNSSLCDFGDLNIFISKSGLSFSSVCLV